MIRPFVPTNLTNLCQHRCLEMTIVIIFVHSYCVVGSIVVLTWQWTCIVLAPWGLSTWSKSRRPGPCGRLVRRLDAETANLRTTVYTYQPLSSRLLKVSLRALRRSFRKQPRPLNVHGTIGVRRERHVTSFPRPLSEGKLVRWVVGSSFRTRDLNHITELNRRLGASLRVTLPAQRYN